MHGRRDVEAVARHESECVARPFGREEDRQPAVGDLECEPDVLRAQGGEIDRNRVTKWPHHQFQRLPQARCVRARVRHVVLIAVKLDGFTAQRGANDLDVLARPRERLAPRLSMPTLDDLRPGRSKPEQEPASRQQVQGCRRHRRVCGRAPRDLHDRGADLDLRRRRRQPRQDRDDVGAPRLRRPGRVIAEPFRFLRERDQIQRVRPRRRISHGEAEAHDLRC